jgi:dihydrofolate reductase
MKKFSIVVAMDQDAHIGYFNRSIGKYAIPWKCKVDMDFFKDLTTTNHTGKIPENQNVVIMGKNTYLSLPNKILPNRINIVVSSSYELWKDKCHPDVTVVPNFQEALYYCSTNEERNIYVIGGSQLYKEALGHNSLGIIYTSIIPKHYYKPNVKPTISFPLNLEQLNKFTYKSLFYKKDFLKVYTFQ